MCTSSYTRQPLKEGEGDVKDCGGKKRGGCVEGDVEAETQSKMKRRGLRSKCGKCSCRRNEGNGTSWGKVVDRIITRSGQLLERSLMRCRVVGKRLVGVDKVS